MITKSVDSHVHLLLSKSQPTPDWPSVRNTLKAAQAHQLNAICVTEHLESKAYEPLMRQLFQENALEVTSPHNDTVTFENLVILPGAEVELDTKINIGIHTSLETLLSLNRNIGHYSLETLHDELTYSGSPFKLVAHHILWPGKTCSDFTRLARYVDAIEVPAKDLANAQKYIDTAKILGLCTTGGSDAHTFIQVGACRSIIGHASDKPLLSLADWIDSSQSIHAYSEDASHLVALASIYRNSLLEY